MRKTLIAKETDHFCERLAQRFEKADYPLLKKTIMKALEKCRIGQTIRYTHPVVNAGEKVSHSDRLHSEVMRYIPYSYQEYWVYGTPEA